MGRKLVEEDSFDEYMEKGARNDTRNAVLVILAMLVLVSCLPRPRMDSPKPATSGPNDQLFPQPSVTEATPPTSTPRVDNQEKDEKARLIKELRIEFNDIVNRLRNDLDEADRATASGYYEKAEEYIYRAERKHGEAYRIAIQIRTLDSNIEEPTVFIRAVQGDIDFSKRILRMDRNAR